MVLFKNGYIFCIILLLEMNMDFLFYLSVVMALSSVCEACGSYIEIAGGGSVTISPGSQYKPNVNCIWWLETDAKHFLSAAINYTADQAEGCRDYFILSEGKDGADVLDDWSQNCTDETNYIRDAKAQWLRIQFKADGNSTTAGTFTAEISSIANDSIDSTLISPIRSCRSFEWKCPNKVCMTLSYRCDDYDDCGCDEDGCDEDGCSGLPLGKYTIMLVGGLVGLGVFVGFAIFSSCYEAYLRRKAFMADPEAQAELQRKKAEKKKREAYKKAAKERKARG
ncbi:hypothetical protein DPMN_013145 [Dreissena polymorpha]|uniref:CUB domain-containing protein n=1 Tax=Dreissena polymorpha TaxID=45954 RepID=A0A9D4S251_DREPO|nr:hypothetical protein DPMN_013145 [Dreissena polymorpha]